MSRLALWVLASLWALGGCGASLAPRHAELAHVKVPDHARYPDDGAVILHREVVALNSGAANNWYSEWLWHDVIAILDQRGLDNANLRCPRPAGAELVAFEARVRSPAGEIRTIDTDDAFIEETRHAGDKEAGEVHRVVLPGVEVGSVIELNCVHRRENIIWRHIFRPHDTLPIERYDAELRVAGSLQVSLRGYGLRDAIGKAEERGQTVYRFGLKDVRARLREPEMVHWTTREPFWIYRTLGYVNGSWQSNYLWSWSDFVKHTPVAKDEGLTADAPPAPDLSVCKGAGACVIETLWAAAIDKADLRDGDSPDDVRKLKEAFAGGRVIASERAMLLHTWLRAAGLEPQYGFAVDRFGFHLDRENPGSSNFDTLLVRVPARPDKGLTKDLWLDPRCETCRAGELSPQSTGIDALTFEVIEQFGKKPEYKTEIRPVIGPLADLGTITRTHSGSSFPRSRRCAVMG